MSGTKFSERTGLQEALQLVEEGKANVVMFYSVDRLARRDDVFRATIEAIYANEGKLAISSKRRIYDTWSWFTLTAHPQE
jgi:DNA invertase Pin-like site-specific DNA recombinase